MRLQGYDVHHIVEQTPARRDSFPESLIQGRDNLVLIPTYRHWEINGWYATANDEFGRVSPREYLRGASWAERLRVGLYALRLHGVLE